ncbi:phage major capsid protein [Streptomyces stelliscabiei]|uniref:HK97 family phage major capsid protein n=1 Tax=Streptomyces stelliscabiei TaxID=146820 RepID=A0A8I0PC26_9ACTN|nr:phage major capsid protein [Streptomyces stelliscabiei]KND30090.1 phage head [Streptomyces stelliscabiei]MBE1599700.1 HK97 family phage major capsid protein [Streptomyces stelliscabiei]MDX2519362.1 phage major capsid protein [Streptomyces stelliscabiei]MDX2549708.1 phage major capsid protein [Streptomyces stelliscabiei]
MAKTIKELSEEMKHHLLKAREITLAAEEDGDRDFTADEAKDLREHMSKATAAKAAIEERKGNDELKATLAQLGDDIALNAKTDEDGKRQTASGFHLPDKGKSLGEQFTASPEYKGLLAQAPNGKFGQKQRVQSEMFGVKSLVTGGSDTSGGALVQNDWRGLQVGLDVFQRPLRIRDRVTPGTTTSDTVEYVRVTSVTNNAAPVPEATSSAAPTAPGGAGALVNNAGGGYKPESGVALAKVTTAVKTIAHWMPATKRALSDAAQIRTLIDAFLMYGLEEELEDQIVNGDGTGENFEGLANVSGVQAQAFEDDLFTTYRRAKRKVVTVGRSIPNAYLINPIDLEELDLLQDNEGRYYFGGPSGAGTARSLWDLPVVETEAVPEGTAYCGDFRKAVLWDREQATVQVTDSHLDFFVRNLVAILAEMRAAFGILQPSAFIEIDLTA